MTRIRLTVILTHPIQYYAPWFRHIAANCHEIDLSVMYAVEPSPEQQGAGFERAFSWDTPLMEEYQCRVLRPANSGEDVLSNSFRGVDVPEVADAIRDAKPDVVLIPGWHSITLVRALFACRRMGIPVLYRGDTHRNNAPSGWRRIAWEARTWAILRLFSGHLSVGRRSRDYLRHFGIPATKIFSAPHCVDNEFFSATAGAWQNRTRGAARRSFGLSADSFVVLFAGKLEDKKRPLDAIRAVPQLGEGASLLVVGSGPLEEECRAEAARLGLPVSWAGFLNQSEIGRAYAAADCLVLPSDWGETWGLVVNEAMATGLPCVVSDRVGCVPDLVAAGETGESFPMGNIEALAHALRRIRIRLADGKSYVTACRARATDHSLKRATEGLLAACQSVGKPRRSQVRVIACCGGMVVVSGMERMIFELLQVLRSRSVSVHCIVNGWQNHRIVALAEPIGASWSTGYYLSPLRRRFRNPMQLVHSGWDIFRTSSGLLRDAWHFRPTDILLPEFTSVLRNAPALALLRVLGVNLVLAVQNSPAPGGFYRFIWRWCVSPFVDRIVGASRVTQEELIAHGLSSAKVSYVYNTIPTRPNLNQQSGSVTRDWGKVVYVGQIIPEKGLHLLLDALGILVARGCNVRADIVGQMEGWVPENYIGYRERLLERSHQPDLRGRVQFLGWRNDIGFLMSSAAVHCLPSLPHMLEGCPVVIIEAKQQGTPSLVFPVGPFRELISHRIDGWVCSEVSAESLAEGLAFFIPDPEGCQRAGEAARASLHRFDRSRFVEGWLRVFRINYVEENVVRNGESTPAMRPVSTVLRD